MAVPQITSYLELDWSMRKFRLCYSAAATLALCWVGGCSSADSIAASKAAEAQADFDQGRIPDAKRAIRKAIAARDDVLDYWLLKARIDLKADDRGSAFSDYEFALQLDHTNIEALQALNQLGLSVGDPGLVDNYADQLLILTPGATMPLVAKGGVALGRGDTNTAEALADRVVAQDPKNLAALTLKARIMIVRGQFADAAALIERTPDTPANIPAKLKLLKDVYTHAHDRAAYELTISRLAAVAPTDAAVQLDYADLLFQQARFDQARSVITRVMRENPTDLQVAMAVLKVLMQTGQQALDPGKMVADAAHLSLLMKADMAQFANETGHPDVAMAILHGAGQGDPTPDNSNAKAALAYAIGVTGHNSLAMDQLNAILAADPDQPWALLARARLLAATHDYRDAVRDARLLVVNDPDSATARLALADILLASGSADLSESALREGLRAMPGSTRLAARLATTVAARGEKDQAMQIARDLFRTASMDRRAEQLAQTYGVRAEGLPTS